MMGLRWALLAVVVACAEWPVSQSRAQDTDELKQLVDRIARGSERDSADAAEQLVERLIGPVAKALGSMQSRPAEEQVRIRRALARLSAALRVRLMRTDLEEQDRKLFDAFAGRYPELVEQLFDDDSRLRLVALRRLPIEPDIGAGVLVAAKVDDPDEDVAVAALEVAAELKDAAVVRGLTRYVAGATEALKSGFYGPDDQEVAVTVALFVSRAAKILTDAGARGSVPQIAEALDVLGRSGYRAVFDTPGIALGLGELRDERAVAALLKLLPDQRRHNVKSLGPGKLLTQTHGDAALFALVRIYGLDPGAFGLRDARPKGEFFGFLTPEAREKGHRGFLKWHQANAEKPAAKRALPTTRPAEKG